MRLTLGKAQHVRGHYMTTAQGEFVWVHAHERRGPTAKPKPTRAKRATGYQPDPQGDLWRPPHEEPQPEPPPSRWGKHVPMENRYHEAAFSHANVPNMISQTVEAAPGLRGVRNVPKDDPEDATSGYYSYSYEIAMHERDIQNDDMSNAVWRHEYGHHVDYMMGRAAGYFRAESSTYVRALVTDSKKLQNFTQRNAKKRMDGYTKISMEIDAHEAKGVTPMAALRLVLRDHGLDPTDTIALIEEHLDDWSSTSATHRDRVGLAVTAIINAMETGQPADITTYLPYCGGMRMFQDFLGAITRNRLKFPCGHTDEYYKAGVPTSEPHYTDAHTKEAYADWFDMQAEPRRTWRQMAAKLAPTVHQTFTAMTQAYVKDMAELKANAQAA